MTIWLRVLSGSLTNKILHPNIGANWPLNGDLAVEVFPETRDHADPGELIPEFCTRYRNEALEPLCLKRSWSNFDPQAYYLYGEDQNYETSFKDKGLQAAVDSWCKIQIVSDQNVHSTRICQEKS